MTLVRAESNLMTALVSENGSNVHFALQTFGRLVDAIIEAESVERGLRDDVLQEWLKFFNRYDDVRYYFFKHVA